MELLGVHKSFSLDSACSAQRHEEVVYECSQYGHARHNAAARDEDDILDVTFDEIRDLLCTSSGDTNAGYYRLTTEHFGLLFPSYFNSIHSKKFHFANTTKQLQAIVLLQ